MKRCNKCGTDKLLSEFSRKGHKRNGDIRYQPFCKECQRVHYREWYINNKDKVKREVKDRKQSIQKWFLEYKTTLNCIKCGESHPSCLEFHHRYDKDFLLSEAASTGKSKETILKEIDKCDVLCSNCHRKFHWNERLQNKDPEA